MTVTTLALLGFAFGLDLLVGEPPTVAHPVAWFGRLVDALDRQWLESDRGQRLAGLGTALLAPLVPAVAAGGLVALASGYNTLAGAIVAGLVLFLTTSLRSLLALTETVLEATDDDLETAREQIRGLVGRETADLSPAEIRSAAIESAAENLADGLVATMVPFALLAPISLPAAAAIAAWIKAVNTLDSMVGYPDKPIGTASARLDDLVMWLPARITAGSIAVAAGDLRVLRRASTWARAPPSPNSGWPMATLACALEIRLTKPGVYDLNADAHLPSLEDGDRALTLVGFAAVIAVIVSVSLAAVTTALGLALGPDVALALESAAVPMLEPAVVPMLEPDGILTRGPDGVPTLEPEGVP